MLQELFPVLDGGVQRSGAGCVWSQTCWTITQRWLSVVTSSVPAPVTSGLLRKADLHVKPARCFCWGVQVGLQTHSKLVSVLRSLLNIEPRKAWNEASHLCLTAGNSSCLEESLPGSYEGFCLKIYALCSLFLSAVNSHQSWSTCSFIVDYREKMDIKKDQVLHVTLTSFFWTTVTKLTNYYPF